MSLPARHRRGGLLTERLGFQSRRGEQHRGMGGRWPVRAVPSGSRAAPAALRVLLPGTRELEGSNQGWHQTPFSSWTGLEQGEGHKDRRTHEFHPFHPCQVGAGKAQRGAAEDK